MTILEEKEEKIPSTSFNLLGIYFSWLVIAYESTFFRWHHFFMNWDSLFVIAVSQCRHSRSRQIWLLGVNQARTWRRWHMSNECESIIFPSACLSVTYSNRVRPVWELDRLLDKNVAMHRLNILGRWISTTSWRLEIFSNKKILISFLWLAST